ncbi:MAG: HAMP domain-containing histidine kinase [Oscillospiraceae bacterium]|nr:HAMP domain-containing histidine kinase [Oscillospiraceae bacterium]
MKYHIGFKILVIFLAVCLMSVTVASGVGVMAVTAQGLYTVEYEQWVDQFHQVRTEQLAQAVAESYAARNLGNLSPFELGLINWGNSQEELSDLWNVDSNSWGYGVYSSGGALLEEVNPVKDDDSAKCYTHRLTADFPVRVQVSDEWTERHEYWIGEGKLQAMYLQYRESQAYDVLIWVTPGCIKSFSGVPLELYEVLNHFKFHLIWVTALGLLLTIACLIYLCFAAGRSPKREGVKPGGLNRLPLDLYAVALGGILVLLWLGFVDGAAELIFYQAETVVLGCVLSCAIALAAALCIIAGIFALAAQCKMGKGYIWRNSFLGRLWALLWKLCKRCYRGLRRLYSLLPLVWKYLLIAFFMAVVPVFCGLMCIVNHEFARGIWMFLLLVAVTADALLVCYGAYAYGTVLKGARTMAEGGLNANIETKYLRGSYKACARDLNALADVAVEAAKQQMKSERMKAELVTNVSHDIKTPLTSVINYIDLLQKAENEEQTKQYLEVLDRQSHKLKKLVDDLMDMSKASSGNMTVDVTSLDASEAVSQALGEFSDRMEEQGLTAVLRKPEQPVIIRADGRLLWRVLHNLMSNIVKYALPGTRVYVDVEQLENSAKISLKNISREELNISADALTERFVRGDASRNTEGSGLGLNIAKGFMQLQKGDMDVTIDGDLFKVTLQFETE